MSNQRRTPHTPSLGFTLIEVMVALAVITVISMTVLGALEPWLGLKSKMDTERKFQDIRQGVISLYESRGMEIEQATGAQLLTFTTSAREGEGCALQVAPFQQNSTNFSESPEQIARDGYMNPWCLFVSGPLTETFNGVPYWYRNMAVVSSGPNGRLETGTLFTPQGTLTLAGDDMGIVISGRDTQRKKLEETIRRMNRTAHMYETYFTTRYLSNPNRDIARYYFSRAYDSAGAIESTAGTWRPAVTVLAGIGVGPLDSTSAWELNNAIEVGNHSESVNGVTVRSPATSGTGALPYTALLRARIAAPSNQTAHVLKVVVGNY